MVGTGADNRFPTGTTTTSIRCLVRGEDGRVVEVDQLPTARSETGWQWFDVELVTGATDELTELARRLNFDALSIHDAIHEHDLPKVDDFGAHLVAVLHGLAEHAIEIHEIDCFLATGVLLTVRTRPSAALSSLWDGVQNHPELARGGSAELLGRLADVLTRRLLSVVDAFDDQVDELSQRALAADASVIGDVSVIGRQISLVRRSVHPQREMLDVLRRSSSSLIGHAGRRRFSDVFDVAVRASSELDAARAALVATLEIYRGSEARRATEVTKVLTIYAAIMLPLSLIAGIFGMNHSNLPGIRSPWGWPLVAGVMVLVAAVSLGMFIALGWIRRPSGHKAGLTLGRGLVEAARAPVHIAGALYTLSTMPLSTDTRPDDPGSAGKVETEPTDR